MDGIGGMYVHGTQAMGSMDRQAASQTLGLHLSFGGRLGDELGLFDLCLTCGVGRKGRVGVRA
jgi:hypothetical protein